MSVKVPSPVRVAYCEEPAASQPADRVFEVFRTLLDHGYSVRRTRSLDADLAAGEPRPTVAIASHSVSATSSHAGNGEADGIATMPATILADLPTLTLDDLSADEVLAQVERLANPQAEPAPANWKPWFPVIDPVRCTNCMQCLSFCLFDVYSVTPGGKISVSNPANCKTDCPACSRVCPAVAIIFPKYKSGPINGDEVSAEDIRREAMKVDISALMGGDIYSLLRDRSERSKSRFSKERDDDRALKERQRCLVKLQQEFEDLSIPASVMANLPSPEEIREKAEAAQRKAQEALARRAEEKNVQ